MEDKKQLGLQHVLGASGKSLHPARSSVVSRSRQAAASAASNPHYKQGVATYNEGNFGEAAANFLLAAQQGHSESQYLLSILYDEGRGVAKDDAQSAHWERKAAEQGHAYAQANVSYRYYASNDLNEAFAWCQRAAESKLPWAQYNLGLMYQKGEGTPQSYSEAAHWYRLAAAQNFADAQQRLAELYSMGRGVAKDYTQAAMWYRRAADHGNAEAQFQLGHLYSIGHGVEQDYAQSRHWIRQAAMQGHDQAVRELKRRAYRDP